MSLLLHQTPEFWKMLVNVVHALLLTGSWEGIRGMGAWVKKSLGATPPWVVAAEAQAKSRWGIVIQWLAMRAISLLFLLLSPFFSLTSSPSSHPLPLPLSLPLSPSFPLHLSFSPSPFVSSPLSLLPPLPPLIVMRQLVRSISRHWTSSTPQKSLSWGRLRKLPMPQLSTSLSTGYVHASVGMNDAGNVHGNVS